MNKKTIAAASRILLVSGLILLLWSAAVRIDVNRKLDLRQTLVASRTIPPRTQITDNDLAELMIPASYLQDRTLNDRSELIGKYTDIQGSIPAGSPFYREMIKDESELPDSPYLQLKEGQSAYTMKADIAKLGGTLSPGQRVDIYATFESNRERPVTGCLLENVRIIAIKDYRGLSLDDPESTGTVDMVILAVNDEDISMFTLSEKTGDVRLFASNRTYSTGSEATRPESSDVLEWLFSTED